MRMIADRDAIDVGILVSDIDRSLAFYQGLLGLEKVEEIDVWFGRFHRLRFGDSFVKLVDPTEPAAPNFPRLESQLGMRYLTFSVRNIDEICAACKDAGVPFEREKFELRPGVTIAMVRDPDGAIVEFVERRQPELPESYDRSADMAIARKVIVSCAVTGSIHTPSMSPYLPITPAEIAESAIDAAAAGAAIVHLHARDPQTGKPDQRPEAFLPFLRTIKQASDVVINLTTGGSPALLVAERVKPAAQFRPEVASLNMGSMNFGLFPMLNRYKSFKHDWEQHYLEGSEDLIFRNTYRDIAYVLNECGEADTRFEFECYDTAHLYNLAHFVDRGIVKPPFFVQSVFGILGGIGQHPEDILHMHRTALRLFGDDLRWSVLGAGRRQMEIAATAAAMGGHVRVGLEDNLWIAPGQLAQTNAEQVTKVRQIIEGPGLEVATPDEARAILGLKGADKVSF